MTESRENIHELLTRRPLSDRDLKHFAELIAEIEGDRRLGVQPTDVFPLGTVDPDALVARFSSPQAGVAELVRRILAGANEKKVNLEIFPKGMFPPFEYDVQATFGQAPQV